MHKSLATKNQRNFHHHTPGTMPLISNQEHQHLSSAETSAYPSQNRKNSESSSKNMKNKEPSNHQKAPMLLPSSSLKRKMENYNLSKTIIQ
jgi:hypothetical protein